jgi:hypothetical protein
MRTQCDPAESYEQNQGHSAENAEKPQMAPLEQRQQKNQKLSVKQSRGNRMAAGKTVTRQVDEWTVDKGPLPMNHKLQPLVQQHAAGHSNHQRHERRPRSFPRKKQHQCR